MIVELECCGFNPTLIKVIADVKAKISICENKILIESSNEHIGCLTIKNKSIYSTKWCYLNIFNPIHYLVQYKLKNDDIYFYDDGFLWVDDEKNLQEALMNTKKVFYRSAISLFICFVLCLSLLSCNHYDDIVFDFYQDTDNGEYNEITIDFGKNNSGIYFIEEGYGIWSYMGEKQLFDFDYVPKTQGGGSLMIYVATPRSYYESMVERNDGLASFYKGKMVFSGHCEFSDDGTVATISPDNIYINELFIDPNHTVVMTKKSISDDEIIPFDSALNDMNFVPNKYIDYTSDRDGWKFSCELANLWVDSSTMTGEWNTNGSIIPIRMYLHETVPYVEIYDTSGSSEKLILKSYATMADEYSIELVAPEGTVFYTTPSSPVIVTKTN